MACCWLRAMTARSSEAPRAIGLTSGAPLTVQCEGLSRGFELRAKQLTRRATAGRTASAPFQGPSAAYGRAATAGGRRQSGSLGADGFPRNSLGANAVDPALAGPSRAVVGVGARVRPVGARLRRCVWHHAATGAGTKGCSRKTEARRIQLSRSRAASRVVTRDSTSLDQSCDFRTTVVAIRVHCVLPPSDVRREGRRGTAA